MRPVLDALPPGDRSLIYTSGIEELNVLMKVGLYAGIFLATPGHPRPDLGLRRSGPVPEASAATPRPSSSSAPWRSLLGAAFCYTGRSSPPCSASCSPAGRPDRSRPASSAPAPSRRKRCASHGSTTSSARRTSLTWRSPASPARARAAVATPDRVADGVVELQARLEMQGRLIDATRQGLGPTADPAIRQALEKRVEAVDAYQGGALSHASELLEQSSALLAGAAGCPRLRGEAALDDAEGPRHRTGHARPWKRGPGPLLTMSEQLSLVLMLPPRPGRGVFELPLVIALLSALGVVKSRWLMKYQRHAFIVCLILAAVITPTGDPFNMAVLAGPMLLCYEIGVFAAWMIERRRARDASQTALTPT